MRNLKTNLLKKICTVSLAAAMLAGAGLTEAGTYIGTAVQVSAVTSSSKETPASSFEYEEDYDGGITIKGFIGNETKVVIPSKIDGKAVTRIRDGAFNNCTNLTEVTIGNGVTSIGYGVFEGCTSLTEATIGNGVTNIDIRVFEGCISLKEINVDKNNKNYSSVNGVLFNKDKTTLIQYPSGKADTEYSISNSITNIGAEAFRDCTSLTEVTIPDSVTSIESGAFYGCKGLKKVTIPDSVTNIGEWAFRDCTSLTEVTISNSVTSIGNETFHYCESLTKVTIGNALTSIGEWAFSDCTSLKDVYYTGSKEEWEKIKIDESNSNLTDATIHYNCSIDDTSNVTSVLSDNNDSSTSVSKNSEAENHSNVILISILIAIFAVIVSAVTAVIIKKKKSDKTK